MSKGFRKSLFGFNTSDVLSYISASDRAAKAKTDKLNNEIATLKEQNEKLAEANKNLVKKNAEYESKKEQIRVMSENVARMYLSAKTTSQILIEKAQENRKMLENENKEQLEALEKTNESMLSVKEHMTATTEDYCETLNELCASLEKIKDEIEKNDKDTDEAINNFGKLISDKI